MGIRDQLKWCQDEILNLGSRVADLEAAAAPKPAAKPRKAAAKQAPPSPPDSDGEE